MGRSYRLSESMDLVEVRNGVVSELSHGGWVRVEELAAPSGPDTRALVRALQALRRHGHIKIDGRGRARRTPIGEEGAAPRTSAWG